MKKLSTLIVTIISLFTFVMVVLPQQAEAQSATIYFSPSTRTVGNGEDFTMTIYLDTAGEDVSGITADFTYDSSIIQATGINVDNSVFQDSLGQVGVAEADYSSPGTIYLSLYTSSGSSYNGTGEVGTVNFTANAEGTATLTYTDDAVVTDTSTTPQNILGTTSSGTVYVGALPSAGLSIFNNFSMVLILLLGAALLIAGTLGVQQYIKEHITS